MKRAIGWFVVVWTAVSLCVPSLAQGCGTRGNG